jgi:hypothetical protein
MPYKYHHDQKAAAMVTLERNRGDVQITSAQTGISVRTLYDWQRSMQVWLQHTPPAVQYTAELPAFENDLEALAFIRQNIIGEVSRLSASLQHDPGFSTPYQRALVMSQLMDKLLKLDLHLRPYMEDDDGEESWMEGFADEEPDCNDDDEDC